MLACNTSTPGVFDCAHHIARSSFQWLKGTEANHASQI